MSAVLRGHHTTQISSSVFSMCGLWYLSDVRQSGIEAASHVASIELYYTSASRRSLILTQQWVTLETLFQACYETVTTNMHLFFLEPRELIIKIKMEQAQKHKFVILKILMMTD